MTTRSAVFGAMSILFLMGEASCTATRTGPSQEDSRKLVISVVEQSAAKFGKICVEQNLLADELDASEEWVAEKDLPGIRYRKRIVAPIGSIPKEVAQILPVTRYEYGCAETLRFYEPTFLEVIGKDQPKFLASVKLDRACGPICGEQYVAHFNFGDGRWKVDGGIKSTGVAM